MSRFKINFELKKLEQVALWGERPNQSIHWFGLTDGLLWIDIGNQTIYEYSKEAQDYFGDCIRYVDYQISRFLEDFSFLFRYAGESIPVELYDDIEDFNNKLERWWDMHEEDDTEELFDYFLDTDYVGLTEWYNFQHTMNSGHLTGGQYISFFRCRDKIKIIWDSTYETENGKSIWTSPSGIIEISYNEFVEEVKTFFQRFYVAMDKQVENAVNKNWGSVSLDKERLIIENKERKEGFNQAISFLLRHKTHTDWECFMCLYEKMNSEIGVLPTDS